MSIDAEKLGPPGVRARLKIVARMKDEKRSDMVRLAANNERTFRISARLSSLPVAAHEVLIAFDALSGGSFAVAVPRADFHVEGPNGGFWIRTNAKSEMSMIEYECRAKSDEAALNRFLGDVSPFLDHLAYATNTPLRIAATRSDDVEQQVQTVQYVAPYRPVKLDSHESTVPGEMLPIYALYREAVNAGSDLYKFLCFFKILEGLFGRLRADVFKRASDLGIRLDRPKDIVVGQEVNGDEVSKFIGMPMKAFLDSELRPRFRNAIAHFETDEGLVLNISDPMRAEQYAGILGIMEASTRAVIETHRTLLDRLAKDRDESTDESKHDE
jgi:hypothetical protein